MIKTLSYAVTGQRIETTETAMLVAGTVNVYTARFAFDEAWDGLQRTAVFAVDGITREQLLEDDACTVPWEVLVAGNRLRVGVYGTKADGTRLPTIWTERRLYIHPGAGPTQEAADPSPTLVEQLMRRIGDPANLKTEDKSSLVAAINEVQETGGGGGTSDHSKLKNRDAAGQHPMSAITGLEKALEGKQPVGSYITEESDPTVPEWAKQPQKPAYTAQEVGALPATTHIPTALSELTDDATHRVVTDAEKSAWNAKSNFTGSYNDLTDKPTIPSVPVQSVNGKTGAVVLSAEDVGALPDSTVIPEAYTLPIASPTVLGGVQPVAKTSEMTQSVGVDEAGKLFTVPGSGGGGGDDAFELIDTIDWSTEEMVVAGAGKTYEIVGATEVLIVWTGLVNSTKSNSSLYINFNDIAPSGSMFTGAVQSGKSGTPLSGYSIFKLFPGVGYTYIAAPGAISSANYAKANSIIPYNLYPDTSEKITKISIVNPSTQYYVVGGTTKIYVR